MREDQSGHGGGREHIAHYEGEMTRDPEEGGEEVPADSVHVEVEGVDLEVYPVEGEGLNEAEDRLAEEGVDAEGGVGLVYYG